MAPIISILFIAALIKCCYAPNPTQMPTQIPQAAAYSCTGFECNVVCDAMYQCYNMTLDASASNILNLYCNGTQSCTHLNLIKAPLNESFIYCNDEFSCKYATFNINNTNKNNKNVELYCNGLASEYPCYQATIRVANSENVSVHCGYHSLVCASMNFVLTHVDYAVIEMWYEAGHNSTIYTQSVYSLTVLCQDARGCEDITIYSNSIVTNMTGINVLCNAQYSCKSIQIYCPSQNAYCNVDCTNSLTCQYINIFIENDNYDLDLICVDGQSPACNGSTITCTDSNVSTTLDYDAYFNVMKCRDDKCCPPSLDAIICPDGSDCVINCLDDSCESKYIDGSAAASLVLNCGPFPASLCKFSYIVCPKTIGSLCRVNCHADGGGGCSNAKIDASMTNEFILNCNKSNSCAYLELSKAPINKSTILCTDSNSCSSARFHNNNTNLVDITCIASVSNSCDRMKVYGSMVNSINIQCSWYSCRNMVVFASNAKSVTISCFDDSACYESTVYADQTDNLNLLCGMKSCMHSDIYCPYQNENLCNVVCYGMNGCKYMSIFVDDNYQSNYLNISCNISSCDSINFTCNPSMYSTTINSDYNISSWNCEDSSDSSCCPYYTNIISTTSIITTTTKTTLTTTASNTMNTITSLFPFKPSSTVSNGVTVMATDDGSKSDNNQTFWIIIIILIAICLVVLGIIIWRCFIYKNNKKIKENQIQKQHGTHIPDLDDSSKINIIYETSANAHTPIKNNVELVKANQKKDENELLIANDDAINDNKVNNDNNDNNLDNEDNVNQIGELKRDPTVVDGVALIHDTSEKNKNKQYAINWSTQNLLDWILKLENGIFKEYENQLNEKFNEEGVNGKNISMLSEDDLRSYGINNLTKRKLMMKYIKDMVVSQAYQPQLEGQIDPNKNTQFIPR